MQRVIDKLFFQIRPLLLKLLTDDESIVPLNFFSVYNIFKDRKAAVESLLRFGSL